MKSAKKHSKYKKILPKKGKPALFFFICERFLRLIVECFSVTAVVCFVLLDTLG